MKITQKVVFLFLLFTLCFGLNFKVSQAAPIVMTGDYSPTYNGSDNPWNVGGELRVGESSTGSMILTGAATVNNTYGVLGTYSGSSGTATVTGAGSEWNNSHSLIVGVNDTGTLNVEAGGKVSNTYGYLGNNPSGSGTATVTGTGSEWNNSAGLLVGLSGTGILNVEAGGKVMNTYGRLGFGSGSSGTATVTGTGSEWNNSSSLYVGGSIAAAGGTGSLTAEDSGLVTVANRLKIWGGGTVTLQGGTIQADTLDISAVGATFNMTGGRLTAATVLGDLTQKGGTLAAGNSPGTMDLAGYALNDGILEVEIDWNGTGTPTAGTDFDLYTANFVDLNGDESGTSILDVLLLSSTAANLEVGDSFEFLTFTPGNGGGTSDLFDQLQLPSLSGSRAFLVTYDFTAGNATLNVVTPEPSGITLATLFLLGLLGFGRRERHRGK